MQPNVNSLFENPIDFDTLNLLPAGLVSPLGRFPSLAPEAHFSSRPRVSLAHEPLVAVAASYAALTLRCRPQMRVTREAYSLVLLSAWLWDDTIDLNKAMPGFEHFVDFALSGFAAELGQTRPVPSAASADSTLPPAFGASLLEPVHDALRLLGESVAIVRRDLAPYTPRILATWWDFWRSFADKAKVELTSLPALDEYERLRSTCVGMYLCYDLAYAIKAQSLGIDPATMLGYLEQNSAVAEGARLSSLHCAAVNDLFSLYKDRALEHTVNFPAVLAKAGSVDGYWEGARRTVEYTRSLVTQLQNTIAALPGPDDCKQIVTRTWLEMMEGNALFHLTVPRYREGVELVKAIIDEDIPPEESRRTFRRTFPPKSPSQTPPRPE